jgi:glycosyltransferase involved in cell wall biosynthesis
MPSGAPLKVLVKSPFSHYSGYGNDGFALVRALHEWGCEVYPQPVWLDVPIPRDLLPLFSRELEGPFDLLINHWDPEHLSITREARGMSRVAVAWTMWEFTTPPVPLKKPCAVHKAANPLIPGREDCPDCTPAPRTGLYPHCKGRSKLPQSLRWFDLLLGYDQISLEALEPYTPKAVAASVLQGGYPSRAWKKTERDWHGDRFGFIMHGALNNRKCPWTAIEAFTQLKHEKGQAFAGASLALHTSAPGLLFPELNEPFEGQRIRVFIESLSKADLDEFYAAGHCLLAPSRGEGKNLPALEMMTTGGVVAATNFGGHTQWMNADYAYPLDYTLAPTFESCSWGAHDARVSVEHMKNTIWHIYTHRDEARRKGGLAADIIPKMCDWQVVIEALFRRVRDSVTSRGIGAQIYDKAMACRREPEQADGLPQLTPAGWRRG